MPVNVNAKDEVLKILHSEYGLIGLPITASDKFWLKYNPVLWQSNLSLCEEHLNFESPVALYKRGLRLLRLNTKLMDDCHIPLMHQ